MLDFLSRRTPPRGKPADAVASDYVPDWPGGLTPALEDVKKRVGRDVAHLSYDRLKVTDEAKQWPFLTIRNDFAMAMRRFIEDVPETVPEPELKADALQVVPDGSARGYHNLIAASCVGNS